MHTVVLVNDQRPALELMARVFEEHGKPRPELLTTKEAAIEFSKKKGAGEIFHYAIDLNLGKSPRDGIKLVKALCRYYKKSARPVFITALCPYSNQQQQVAAMEAGAGHVIPKTSVDKDALGVIRSAAMFDSPTPDDLLRRVELEMARCAVVEACERLEQEGNGGGEQDGARDEIRGILEFRTLNRSAARILTMLDQQLTVARPRELSEDLRKFLSRGLDVAINGKEQEKLKWLDSAYARDVQGIIPWLDNGDKEEGQGENNDDGNASDEHSI